ncbi:UPF0481 protein At3g47200 isoform X2 [Medicago truncatula]|uniref:UPF0481 protein At3g47200 isoform X2 n=1 Tax=Medicago truncatula TaxID=3880 RepID=UPI000D2F1977|nr:UPF0481 protein At3g47200 isoform X2 [Medicago truncatula]
MMASQPTLERKVVELQRYIDTNPTPPSSKPKIQRVAEYLRKRENFEKHYIPRFVSIGPIHHGSTDLELGEKYKLMWAAEYIKKTESILKDLHKKIADNIDTLKDRFSDDVLTLTRKSLDGFGSLEEKLSWILFVDGCSLLHILEKWKHFEQEHMTIVMMDVLLLENQLPYEVLKLLWKDDNQSALIESMTNFFNYLHLKRDDPRLEKEKKGEGQHSVSMPDESLLEPPNHLLDLHRKMILTASNSKELILRIKSWKWPWELCGKLHRWIGMNSERPSELRTMNSERPSELRTMNSERPSELRTHRNIQDLKAVGIRLKSSNTPSPKDIHFSDGWFTAELTLPMIIVTDSSASTFFNLTAYEMCPDFENKYEICSFVVFMESLIDHPEDVKELRSKGILRNKLGSDEEVAHLFNIISTDLRKSGTYNKVSENIHKHYRNKYKNWIAQRFHTHFSNPWAITAFLAAFIALALTFIQTWFTVNPPRK